MQNRPIFPIMAMVLEKNKNFFSQDIVDARIRPTSYCTQAGEF
jgi:hypothetical protein